ncbi:MAG: hypothetical protein QM296_11275 [Bacillota bacterium]|nr:hypothetical protein [Bacillota bacterium]
MQPQLILLDPDPAFARRLAWRLLESERPQAPGRLRLAYCPNPAALAELTREAGGSVLVYRPERYPDWTCPPGLSSLRLHESHRLHEVVGADGKPGPAAGVLTLGEASEAFRPVMQAAADGSRHIDLHQHAGLALIRSQLERLFPAAERRSPGALCRTVLIVAALPPTLRAAALEKCLAEPDNRGRRVLHLPLLPAADCRPELLPVRAFAGPRSDLAAALDRCDTGELTSGTVWSCLSPTPSGDFSFAPLADAAGLRRLAASSLERLVSLLQKAVTESRERSLILLQSGPEAVDSLPGVASLADEAILMLAANAAVYSDLGESFARITASLPPRARYRDWLLPALDASIPAAIPDGRQTVTVPR